MNKLLAAAAETSAPPFSTRVINVTSAGHRISPIRFSDYNFEPGKKGEELPPSEKPAPNLPPLVMKPDGSYSGLIAYGQSKTANILFSLSLSDKLWERGVKSFAVHPGSIWTDLSRNLDEKSSEFIGKTAKDWKSLDEGAATMLVAAFDPKLSDSDGVYLSDCQIAEPAPHAADRDAAERLWKLSEKLVGEESELEKGFKL